MESPINPSKIKSATKNLQIEEKHLEIIKSIIKKYPFDVFVFGSRSKKNAQKFSDLDLAIKGEPSKLVLSKLREEFEESNLPYRVDIVIWKNLSREFQNHIQNDFVQISETP